MYKTLIHYIETNQDQFYRIAFSYTKNKEDALDIVQDTIEKALKKYRSIRNPEFLKTWFYRILINTCMSFFRKVKPLPYIEQEAHHDHSYLDLYDALDQLSKKDRSLIILRYFEDLKFSEISNILNMNINTVKTRHTKILKELKEQLDLEVDYV